MKNWKEALIAPDALLRDAIRVLDRSATQIGLVTDNNLRLLGTITDGDIRRGLLRGLDLDAAVTEILHTNPTTATLNESDEFLVQLMESRQVYQIPILDEQGVVVGLRLREGLGKKQHRDNPVVIMAGGLGSRLRPLTQHTPKPLLQIGAKPIIETIIEGFFEQGFRTFFISLNYKADMFREILGDGSRWGVQIRYLSENQPLGTAGALSLLPTLGKEPIFVMNGDILTRINYKQLLAFHEECKAVATMCVREFTQQIPFGVVTTDKHYVTDIIEKPIQKYNVNAGIYLLNPELLPALEKEGYLDMPSLLMQAARSGQKVAAFPVREYWIDIGQIQDFHRANDEYYEYFPESQS